VRTLIIALLVAGLAAVAAPALAATRSVRLVDNRFSPASLTVRAGDTVVFRHAGQAPHNVVTTGRPPQRFASPLLRRGQSYRRTLNRAGRYRLVCTLHPGMRMTLRVR
jgi:plastocyanin